jgi:copper chaperone for superoxide dismutase
MTCQSCVDSVTSVLSAVTGLPIRPATVPCSSLFQGVSWFDVNLAEQRVLVDSTLPTAIITEHLLGTGLNIIIRGHGMMSTDKQRHTATHASAGSTNLGAAVCIIEEGDVSGVVRFAQVNDATLVIDGTLDGLSPGLPLRAAISR